MTPRRAPVLAAAFAGLVSLVPAADARAQAAPTPPLWTSDEPLAVRLTADFEALDGDRSESPDRPAIVSVVGPDGTPVAIGAEVHTRGAFRLDRSNCFFPPLRIDVDGSDARGTPFEGLDDLKLVSSCRPGRRQYDELVPLEYLAYRAYAALTDSGFRVRLLDVTFVDVSAARAPETRLAFVVEDDDALAERHGATVFELEGDQNLPARAFEPVSATLAAVFEYMIGNTDWSEVAGHNVTLLERGGTALAVPYDFDFSGLVDAPYATPDPVLGLRTVRDRRYRGHCVDPAVMAGVLARFRAAREGIVGLFAASNLLDGPTRERAASYLQEFFDDIETDERAERRFLRDCRA
jgi:hypothetical protein